MFPAKLREDPAIPPETANVSVYLLGEPKLARALNAITLEEQESDDLIDATNGPIANDCNMTSPSPCLPRQTNPI